MSFVRVPLHQTFSSQVVASKPHKRVFCDNRHRSILMREQEGRTVVSLGGRDVEIEIELRRDGGLPLRILNAIENAVGRDESMRLFNNEWAAALTGHGPDEGIVLGWVQVPYSFTPRPEDQVTRWEGTRLNVTFRTATLPQTPKLTLVAMGEDRTYQVVCLRKRHKIIIHPDLSISFPNHADDPNFEIGKAEGVLINKPCVCANIAFAWEAARRGLEVSTYLPPGLRQERAAVAKLAQLVLKQD